jgi:hypothetical protein
MREPWSVLAASVPSGANTSVPRGAPADSSAGLADMANSRPGLADAFHSGATRTTAVRGLRDSLVWLIQRRECDPFRRCCEGKQQASSRSEPLGTNAGLVISHDGINEPLRQLRTSEC